VLRQRFLEGVNRFSPKGKAKATGLEKLQPAHHLPSRGLPGPGPLPSFGRDSTKLDKDWREKAIRIFHLATPPELFGVIPKMLAGARPESGPEAGPDGGGKAHRS
jgi:hypothetical protein